MSGNNGIGTGTNQEWAGNGWEWHWYFGNRIVFWEQSHFLRTVLVFWEWRWFLGTTLFPGNKAIFWEQHWFFGTGAIFFGNNTIFPGLVLFLQEGGRFPGKAAGLTGDFRDALQAWHGQQDDDSQIRPHPERALAQQEAGDAHELLPCSGKSREKPGSGRTPRPSSRLATGFP